MASTLQPNALVSLERAKSWFDNDPEDTDADELLTDCINAASDGIEDFCRRAFRQAAYVDEPHDGDGTGYVPARNPPIAASPAPVLSIVPFPGAAPVVLVLGTGYVVDADRGGFQLTGGGTWARFPAGVQNVLLGYTGGFAAIPARVELACRLVVMQHWFAKAADPAAQTRAIGPASRTRVIDRLGVPPEAVPLLVGYRRLLSGVVAAPGAVTW